MPRKIDWPKLLALFIQEKSDQPFVWGQNDCCLFVCDWVIIATGQDPASELNIRGSYYTALGATRILNRFGGVEMLAKAWSEKNGWSVNSVSYAKRGDVVTFQTADGLALGVCDGLMSVFAGPNGITRFRTRECVAAYHIPYL